MYVWYIYIHEWFFFYGFHVAKYTSPMDPLGVNMLYKNQVKPRENHLGEMGENTQKQKKMKPPEYRV